MTLHLILFQKPTSLTNLFLRKFMYLQKWFHDNYMVLNPGKSYYMTFGLNTTKNKFVFEDCTIARSVEEHVVLGITIDSHLTFNSHLKQLCKKVANKLNALTRIAPYLNYNQRIFIYSFFFTVQLSHCSLMWISAPDNQIIL